MKQEKVWFKNSKEQKLCGRLYIPDGTEPFPAVVFVHGFGGGIHERKNIHMCKELADAGFVSLQFDFYDDPNHESEPKIETTTLTQQLDGTRSAIDFIEKLPYVDKNKIGLTGHSLGGMTVALYTPRDKRIKALVIQSAVSNFSELIKRFEEEGINLTKWKKDRFFEFDKSWGGMKINYQFIEDGMKYDVYEVAEKIKCPTLIFHGEMDESVIAEQSKELIKHIKHSKLEIIKNADHCYYENNTLPIATNLMISFFKEHLK